MAASATGRRPLLLLQLRASAHDAARPEFAHRVRGGQVSEHRRVLGRRHRHHYAYGGHLYARLSLLPHQDVAHAAAAGRERAGARERRHRPVGSALRGAHQRGPRRPAGRWRATLCGDGVGVEAQAAGAAGGDAHARLWRRPGRRAASGGLGRGCVRAQRGNGAAAAAGRLRSRVRPAHQVERDAGRGRAPRRNPPDHARPAGRRGGGADAGTVSATDQAASESGGVGASGGV
eukprot:ctg_1173.g257